MANREHLDELMNDIQRKVVAIDTNYILLEQLDEDTRRLRQELDDIEGITNLDGEQQRLIVLPGIASLHRSSSNKMLPILDFCCHCKYQVPSVSSPSFC